MWFTINEKGALLWHSDIRKRNVAGLATALLLALLGVEEGYYLCRIICAQIVYLSSENLNICCVCLRPGRKTGADEQTEKLTALYQVREDYLDTAYIIRAGRVWHLWKDFSGMRLYLKPKDD